jgi:acidic leucine-rich nuclear phosphoprotein 32 family protein A/C/D/acidic leucine-rich nuclear phosphoprotein 32 family protein B
MEGRMKLKESEDDEDLDEENEEPDESDEGEDDAEQDSDGEVEAAPETDNVGDASVEINVEELIHEIEVENGSSRPDRELAAKRRLEELMEKKRAKRDLEDFDDYEV